MKTFFGAICFLCVLSLAGCDKACNLNRPAPDLRPDGVEHPNKELELKKDLELPNPLSNALKDNWDTLKGKAQVTWDKLTDQDLNEINGDYGKLVEAIQVKYQKNKEEAVVLVKDFIEKNLQK